MIYSCDNCGRLKMDDVVRSKCKECVTTNNPTDEPSWWIPDDKPDMVNNPQHYQSENGLEVIDVIEAFTAELKGIDAVCRRMRLNIFVVGIKRTVSRISRKQSGIYSD